MILQVAKRIANIRFDLALNSYFNFNMKQMIFLQRNETI